MYTEAAVIDDIGAGPGNTVDQMVEFLPRALEKVVLIEHAISTSRVDIDGDTARAKTVCTARWYCPRPTAGPRCSFRACGTKTSS